MPYTALLPPLSTDHLISYITWGTEVLPDECSSNVFCGKCFIIAELLVPLTFCSIQNWLCLGFVRPRKGFRNPSRWRHAFVLDPFFREVIMAMENWSIREDRSRFSWLQTNLRWSKGMLSPWRKLLWFWTRRTEVLQTWIPGIRHTITRIHPWCNDWGL